MDDVCQHMILYDSHNLYSTSRERLALQRQEFAMMMTSKALIELASSVDRERAEDLDNLQAKLIVENLSAGFGKKSVLENVSVAFKENTVTAIIGPSGCGKSTFIRCLNRMHEVTPEAWASGRVLFDDEDIYSLGVDPVAVRRRIGMVFQKPNPFPTMSIYDNVAAGLRLNGVKERKLVSGKVEEHLKKAFLWDEIGDRIHESGASISGGQQQRLCIARALAVEPEIVLMDEPCSALDPVATAKIEELITKLKETYTIIVVTHNMQQAARISDLTGFLYLGKLIEFGPTRQIFETPRNELTERYISGKFG
jgi:phosphate transport system ATP-binding protein